MKMRSLSFRYEVVKYSSFLEPTMVGGDVPFHLKLLSNWPTPSEKSRFRPISAYNVSTVRASENSSISANKTSATRFPASYRRSPCVTPNPQKVAQKAILLFKNKFSFSFVIVEAHDFKFGIPLGFAKAHH